MPLHLLLTLSPMAMHVGAIVAISALGIWSSGAVAKALGQKDPGLVVIDEVAGVLIAMAVVRDEAWWWQASAFALFRLLDISKPPPIRQAERAQPPGLGIMLDDLVAGALTAAIVWGIVELA